MIRDMYEYLDAHTTKEDRARFKASYKYTMEHEMDADEDITPESELEYVAHKETMSEIISDIMQHVDRDLGDITKKDIIQYFA